MADMTGGVDSSIPLQAGRGVAPAQNPLDTIGKFAGIQNALNLNKAFPGQLALQQQAITGGQLSLDQHVNRAAAQGLFPMLADGTPITHDAVTSRLAALEAQGLPTGHLIKYIAQASPGGDGPAFDQFMRAQILSGAAENGPDQRAAVLPTPGTVDNGQAVVPTMRAPSGMPGQGSITQAPGGIRLGITPGQGAQRVPIGYQPDGVTPIYGPLSDVTPPSLGGTAGQSPLGTGRPVPPALIGPGGRGGAPAPDASGHVAAPAVGAPEAVGAQVAPAQALADRVPHFQTDMYPLIQAQTALATAPTGKGSEAVHSASSYLNTFAPSIIQRGLAFISPLMTPSEVTAYDEAKKYLTQGTLGMPGSTRSNEGQAMAGAASPNTQISKEATQLVLKGMIGLRRMEQDEGQSWIASGQPPSQLNAFRADFQKQADPRVYLFDQMTPQERQQTLAGIKDPAKRNAFIAGVQRAEANGVLSAPGQANVGQ